MTNTRRLHSGILRTVLIALFLTCIFFIGQSEAKAASKVTVYNNVDYSRVYDFDYYIAHYSSVRKAFANNPTGALKYFVTKGMSLRHRACESFDVTSYIYGNKDLRRAYANNIPKYYRHYMTTGYKQSARKSTFTGVKVMKNYETVYKGVDLKKVYSYNYYVKKYPSVFKTYGYDDVKVLTNFVVVGMKHQRQGNSTFNVTAFMQKYPSLVKKYGNSYYRYYRYYCKYGNPKPESEGGSSSSTGIKYNSTINGKKTLKSFLQNAMVPVGRTLYIWGGGHGGSDEAVIGYLPGWATFFSEHATSDYDYSNYRYKYGSGLDCSGYVGWVLYNTVHTQSGNDSLTWLSSETAPAYASKGWATLAKNGEDETFKPGDVVSMSGHVWISLGQYSDGSVLLVHSSPKGVQISGTSGTAYQMADTYMKKYFKSWPYATRQVGSGYLHYVSKARWKVSGSGALLKDPDGVQKMTPTQVMNLLFG